MTTRQFDPDQYKADQRQDWDAVAVGWRKWWDTFERGAQHVSDRLMELAEVAPGQRVLDVATGIGEPACTAARLVGPAGHVVATDQAPQMLAIARDRSDALGLANMELREMDAEALALPENNFDAILCRWGLMFLPNLAAALSGMRRLLTPPPPPSGGGAAAVWSAPPKVPFISLPVGELQQLLEMTPPPEGTPNPFNLADVSALEQALSDAGFTDVRTEHVAVTMEWSSSEEYVAFLRDIAPVSSMLAPHPPQKQAQAWQAIQKAAQQYVSTDSAVRMPNETICVVGRR